MSSERYLEFDLGNEQFAIPLILVKEVISLPSMTPIPRAPDYFSGVMNLRGMIITVLDLRKKMSITPKEDQTESAVIIINHEEIQLGVIVDEANRVLAVEKSNIVDAVESSSSKHSKFVQGIIKQDEGQLTVLLDIMGLLDLNDLLLLKNDSEEASA